MGRGKQEASAALAALVVIFVLVGDKVMDTVIAAFADDGIKKDEILPLLLFLCGIALVMWALQNGILRIFSKMVRKFRRTDKFISMENDLRIARITIKQGLEYLISQRYKFDEHVDFSANMVASLNPSSPRFREDRHQAANTVFLLKEDYHQNIETVQAAIDRLYENITVAEQIFVDAEEWASKTAPKYWNKGEN